MRTIILSVLCINSWSLIFAQTQQAKWTKEDRNKLFDECYENTKKNKMSNEQKESICLCFIDEISKKYPKEEYEAKIKIELTRIHEVTLAQCSKNIGISASNNNIDAKKTVNTNDLYGQWDDGNSKFWLYEGGDFKLSYNNGKTVRGTWILTANKLTLYRDKLIGKSEKSFDIMLYTHDAFVYKSTDRKQQSYTVNRIVKSDE